VWIDGLLDLSANFALVHWLVGLSCILNQLVFHGL
jgi:hypothetical protein